MIGKKVIALDTATSTTDPIAFDGTVVRVGNHSDSILVRNMNNLLVERWYSINSLTLDTAETRKQLQEIQDFAKAANAVYRRLFDNIPRLKAEEVDPIQNLHEISDHGTHVIYGWMEHNRTGIQTMMLARPTIGSVAYKIGAHTIVVSARN